MTRLRMIGLCLVAALAISVVAVATAAAAAPEFGRCIKKVAKTGEGYSNAGCTTHVSTEGRFEWEPGPGANNRFSSVERFVFTAKYNNCTRALGEEEIALKDKKSAEEAAGKGETELAEKLEHEATEHQKVAQEYYNKSGVKEPVRAECEAVIASEHAKAPAELETVGGTKITCGGVTGEGEYSRINTKAVVGLTTTFTECSTSGFKCASPGAEPGEIKTSTLQGELGVIEKENPITKAKAKIGIDLSAGLGANVAEFRCGVPGFETSVVVTGSVIHQLKSDTMVLEETETFTQAKGKQKPESFEEQPVDVLESSISGGANVQSGMTIRGLLTNQEKIEVNGVV